MKFNKLVKCSILWFISNLELDLFYVKCENDLKYSVYVV